MLDVLAGEQIPVFVVTGFLGSGKTTLLRRLLESGELRDTAILVNEFASLGIDQLLVREVSERVVLLDAGCICCTVRDDLLEALRELFIDRLRGDTQPFQRVVIETSGLGDPVPILHTLQTDPFLRERFRVGGTLTLVDACQPLAALFEYPEGRRQVAVADRYVLTKADLAPPAQRAGFAQALAHANPEAPVCGNAPEDVRALARDLTQGAIRPAARGASAAGFANRRIGLHRSQVQSFVLRRPGSLDWGDFVTWVQALTSQPVLRMKGVLDVEGQPQRVLVHAVRHVFYPSEPLPLQANSPSGSSLVLILDNPERLPREALLAAALPAGASLCWQVEEEAGIRARSPVPEMQPS